jgi:branched-chain amino acid transport system substrate-binding protein
MYPVQIISKDSQSSTARASEVAAELILRDKVDLIVAASTPDTTNPVADQAEVNEVPCVTTDCPWQPYFFGRKGDPAKGFTWTYHFFWGLDDVTRRSWRCEGRPFQVVGGLFRTMPALAWATPGGLQKPQPCRLSPDRPGRYQPVSNDFPQISAFKSAEPRSSPAI